MEDVICELKDSLQSHISNLKSRTVFEGNFNGLPSKFNSSMIDHSTSLVKQFDLVSMSYFQSNKPTVEQLAISLSNIYKDISELVAMVLSLNDVKFGKTFCNQWKDAVYTFIFCAVAFFSELASQSPNPKSEIGKIWSASASFVRIPDDNCKCVVKVLRSDLALVEDALEELSSETFPLSSDYSDSLSSLGDNLQGSMVLDVTFTEEEIHRFIKIAAGLVKTVKAAIKCALRPLENTSEDNSIAACDEVLNKVSSLSPATDEFILTLYPPRRVECVKKEAHNVEIAVTNVVQCLVSNNFYKNDSNYISVLEKTLEHNITLINSFIDSVKQ